MSDETCRHCGGVDSWHHDLTECVGALKAQLAESERKLAEANERAAGFEQSWQNEIRASHTLAESQRRRLEESERKLANLLARVHRDGGHYQAQHGVDKATSDADAVVVALQSGLEESERKVARLEAELTEYRALKQAAFDSEL